MSRKNLLTGKKLYVGKNANLIKHLIDFGFVKEYTYVNFTQAGEKNQPLGF